MVSVPYSRSVGPRFDSRCRQVGGSVLIQPPCRNGGNCVYPTGQSREETDVGNPIGASNIEIDYIVTNWPDILTDITVINQVNMGSDHIMVMGNIKLDVESERNKGEQRLNSNSN